MKFMQNTTTTMGLAAGTPAYSARVMSTTFTKAMRTLSTQVTTTSIRCPTGPTPATSTLTGQAAGRRPSPTAATSTSSTTDTAMPPMATTTTSTSNTSQRSHVTLCNVAR